MTTKRLWRALVPGAMLTAAGFLAVATPADAQPTTAITTVAVAAPAVTAASPMYPYAYYTSQNACHDQGLSMIDSGEVARYMCFYENYGPNAGLYHLYTN